MIRIISPGENKKGFYFNSRQDIVPVCITTLNQIHRIESLRWRICLRRERLFDKSLEIIKNIKDIGGEAFIPGSCYDDNQTQPRRIIVKRDRYDENDHIQYDDDYFRKPECKITARETPLGELADIGDQTEWELELERRIARVTTKQLELGERYDKNRRDIHALHCKIGFFNDLLDLAITQTGIIPKSNVTYSKIINIQINGRIYPYEQSFDYRHQKISSMVKYWPLPSVSEDTGKIINAPETFTIDESLIGLPETTIRARFSDPANVIRRNKKTWHPYIWVYDGNGIQFNERREVEKLLNKDTVDKIIERQNKVKSKRTLLIKSLKDRIKSNRIKGE